MTYTKQPRSLPIYCQPSNENLAPPNTQSVKLDELQTDESFELLISIYNSLAKLNDRLGMLDNLMKKRLAESNMEDGEEKNED